MEETLAKLAHHRIVPAVIIDDASTAAPLADAMVAGGLPVIEVTLRTPDSLRALEELAAREDMIVGAGTVTSLTQLDAARRAGARFIVTPGLDDPIIRHCRQRDLLVIPGAVTPTEIMRAQNLGLSTVKFFPCHAFGGLTTIEALAGPFPSMTFLPTGGIHLENLQSFLRHPSVFACGGTWMARREWIQGGKWDAVTQACRQTVQHTNA
ncbi:MAG TPA: bifunctional 4-hydroxy-2-oxoglutarate aldolase/2-dehydro-3-deoxy-phosphogluconate aldolase [Prosthecobacter sp.]|nr:bifunctional 4-hydroxy-2-oxoglutarate aldolase/2-dehydro-3-deoxy-phosphogluconate aldolase [Prosthecobacter sp.]